MSCASPSVSNLRAAMKLRVARLLFAREIAELLEPLPSPEAKKSVVPPTDQFPDQRSGQQSPRLTCRGAKRFGYPIRAMLSAALGKYIEVSPSRNRRLTDS